MNWIKFSGYLERKNRIPGRIKYNLINECQIMKFMFNDLNDKINFYWMINLFESLMLFSSQTWLLYVELDI